MLVNNKPFPVFLQKNKKINMYVSITFRMTIVHIRAGNRFKCYLFRYLCTQLNFRVSSVRNVDIEGIKRVKFKKYFLNLF